MSIYRGTGGANEATDLATNQAALAKGFAEDAANSATEALQTLDQFQDIYLGAFSSAPTFDNDGNTLQVGALYFNTSDKLLRIYDGVGWLVSAVSEPSSFARNTFSGNGSQTVFVLSTTPVNNDSVFVFISGVLTTAYNVSGVNLTFTSAPPSGTNNVLAIVASTVSIGAPADGSVSTDKLQDGAVTTIKMGNSQVTSSVLADNSVTSNKIANGSVSSSKLASNSVDATKIANGAVGTNQLASNAVTTAKITDASITTTKLSDAIVSFTKLVASIFSSATTVTLTSSDYLVISDTSDFGNTKKALVSDLSSIIVTVPSGTIIDFAGSTAPTGYLNCPTGQTLVNIADYPTLYAAIGTLWGGDGVTTFGLPYFPADYTGVAATSNVGSSTVGQVISHSHQQTNSARDQDTGGGGTGPNTVGSGSNMGLVTSNQSTLATGGSANLAAGMRIKKCVKV